MQKTTRSLVREGIALTVSLALLVATTACHDTTRLDVAPNQVSPAGPSLRIVGVTTLDGKAYRFDKPATVEGDAVVGKISDGTDPSSIKDETPGGSAKDRIVTIPIKDVQRFLIEEKKLNTWKTVGLVAGIVAAGVLIGVAASGGSKSSPPPTSTTFRACCPFFYSWDGTRWVFDAEPYPGAVTAGLERTGDVTLEHLRPVDGTYRILMTNERPETEYTDMVSLHVVDHAPGLRVVPGDDGALWGVSAPVPPLSARTAAGEDLTLWLSATDARIYEPAPPKGETADLRDTIVLTFPKPAGARTAKLVANVGTSQRGGEMFERFLELWGQELPALYASIDADPNAAAALYDWNLETELWGLKIDVEETAGWRTAGSYLGAGPLVVKERALPLDLSRVAGDVLRIRIRPPRGYWALNSFAVDYSDGAPLAATEIPVASAIDTRGADRRAALLAADGLRDEMPKGDGPVALTFRVPDSKPGLERTVVLRARGFYRPDVDTSREPDVEAIHLFQTEPDYGVRFLARATAK